MPKSTFDAPRGNVHKFAPSDIKIAGIDFGDEKHTLHDVTKRNNQPDEKLAENIARFGLIEPVVVNKDGTSPVVIEGRRRVLAGRLLEQWIKKDDPRAHGLTGPLLFDCSTKRGDATDLIGMMISANEQRVDQTPMTRARQALKMVEKCGATEEDAAIAFGVTTKAIKGWLKLVDLAAPVQRAVDEGRIAASAALELATLPKDEQGAKLEEIVAETHTNGTKPTGRTVRQKARGDEAAAPGKKDVRKARDAVGYLWNQFEGDGDKLLELVLGWVVGDVPPSRIKGLTKVLRGEVPD